MAKQKSQTPDLKFEDLKVNNVYRSKRPKLVGGFFRQVDDRQIIHISAHKSVVETIDHGYTEEFIQWCEAPGEYRHTFSIDDQSEYELATNKPCRKLERVLDYMIQYDSPSVARGKKYPIVPASKFLKWASSDVTSIMPKGEWAITL